MVLVCVPHYVKDLILFILSRPQLEISIITQDSITHNISPLLLYQSGWLLLTITLVLLIPAFIGYFGSVRESRACLILVRFFVVCEVNPAEFNLKHIDNC